MMQQKNISPFIVSLAVVITGIALLSLLTLFGVVYELINHIAFLEMKANRY
jgi:hypothetical protein